MFPTPKPSLSPNTYAYESEPLVKATGFREYDARWLFEKEINLMGVQALGMGLGTLIRQMGVRPEIVIGHDFRSYSASIKYALITGLLAAGCKVHDIGLAVTPMAYFAQFDLDVPCVAMVTASHNDNGWTGVKMGAQRPLTFGPDEMTRLKDIVLGAKFDLPGGGAYRFVENFPARYIADLTDRREARSGGSRWWRRAATAPRAPSRRRCWKRSAARWCRSTAPSTTPSRATIPTPKTWRCCTRSATRCWRTMPMSASASTATATAAAWSTTRARRFSPTRSASCWRATCRACIPARNSSST